MHKRITDYALYRWRYAISYSLIALIVGGLLAMASLHVPGGLSNAETVSTVASSSLSLKSFDPMMAVNFPYALLQQLSFLVLGITTLSIKLPSLLLGFLTAVGIILLFRSWFHDNVAIIAALIAFTTSQFVFTSQDGTPSIMYILLPVWLLLSAMMVSRQLGQRSLWEFLLIAAAALSLYTPLSAYLILALVSAALLHPHLRFIVGRLSKQKLIIAGMIGLVLLAPLITSLILEPRLGLLLLGIPVTSPDLQANGLELGRQYLSFGSQSTSGQLLPVYTLPVLSFVLLGLTRLATTKYTARSYIITAWAVLLAPILLLNPGKVSVTFVPIVLLIAMGVEVLLSRWYSLFPRNPYARVAGLVPITVLVAGMALTGVERYLYGHHYTPAVAESFSHDLRLLDEEVRASQGSSITLAVAEPEVPFYQAVALHRKDIHLIQPGQPLPEVPLIVVSRAAFRERELGEPYKIVTSSLSSEADRLYLYKAGTE